MRGVKVQNTHNLKRLGETLVELVGFLNSPQRDDALLREAGVEIDRALFPILVALGARGVLGIAEIADLVGRDYTTVSRQVTKLASLRFVARAAGSGDRRQRTMQLTAQGQAIVRAITAARLRLLSRALSAWSDADIGRLADLNRRFAQSLGAFAGS